VFSIGSLKLAISRHRKIRGSLPRLCVLTHALLINVSKNGPFDSLIMAQIVCDGLPKKI
jgi:hypothetical protein